MSDLWELAAELLMEGVFAVISLIFDNRKEKSDLQKLMIQQREEHAVILRQLAVNGKKRSLRGYDLTGTILDDIDLAAVELVETSFRDAQVSKANLQDANLTGADFSGAHLKDVDFSRANLSWATFADAKLQNVNFDQANLRGAQLSEVNDAVNCKWNEVYINSFTELKPETRSHIENSF